MADPDFEAAVYRVIAALRFGEVATYGEIAAEAGYPGAARAVGNFLRRSEGLPWWRVVAAGGRLVPGAEEEQAVRLRVERVEVVGGRVVGGRTVAAKTLPARTESPGGEPVVAKKLAATKPAAPKPAAKQPRPAREPTKQPRGKPTAAKTGTSATARPRTQAAKPGAQHPKAPARTKAPRP